MNMQADKTPMIVARNITKRYGAVRALDNVSFEISAGESVALWGANGAGKTTTLRCLLGVHGFEGALTVGGRDVHREGRAVRALIGYVPQEARFDDLTVTETLRFYARLKRAAPDRAAVALREVQLEAHAEKRVSMLSGGMKQRLALAVALLSDPPVLMLDEPTANLDVQAQRDFVQAIQRLNHAGKTIIFSSHRLDEVLALATRVIVLDSGAILADCLPHELPEKLGLSRWLRLWVMPEAKAMTLQVLTGQGFECSPNGHSIFVRLNNRAKMDALHALQQADIAVLDFDLVGGDAPGTGGQSHD
ncbi:MAG: ABC transporter ATP-binding protein [Anaerolineae bacterium]